MEPDQNLDNKCKIVLDKFAKKYLEDKNTVGIILSGSYVHSKPDKNSDLDVFIVLGEGKFRERGNLFIDGIEVEYFINPIKQIEEYFKEESSQTRVNPTTAHIFANSVVLFKKGDYLDKLIKKAKKIIKNKPEKPKKFQIETMRYHIDDMRKDLEDVFLREDLFAFNIISNEILKKSIEIFYSMKRVYGEKNKRLQFQLRELDPVFENKFSKVLLEKNITKKFKLTNELISYTEKLLGGKRPDSWKLKGKCTFIKK